MQRKPRLTIVNLSGDTFVRTYDTDEEAETLFMSNLYRCGKKLTFTPSTGDLQYTWLKELSDILVCAVEPINKE